MKRNRLSAGFRPRTTNVMPVASRRAHPLLWRQKDPKPFLPCRGPAGSLRGSPTPAAAQLAEFILCSVEGLRQCSPYLQSLLRFSATPKAEKVVGRNKV